MPLHYISKTNFHSFIKYIIKKYFSYGLTEQGENLNWTNVTLDNIDKIIANRYRAVHPIKMAMFPVKEEVTKDPLPRKVALIGVKACDIKHTLTMNKMFVEGGIIDPYYTTKRDNTLIISCDCDSFKPSCFCTLIEGKPFAETGFDINLTSLKHGFLAETGTKKGEELISSNKELFSEAKKEIIQQRDDLRKNMVKALNDNNKEYKWSNPKKIVSKNYESRKWKEDIAKTCVECDACRFVCGTCYCFLLGETAQKWGKIRNWDSCQSEGYGRVAGGSNPRKSVSERLRNFYACKLLYRPENFGFYACTGCGRCIDVCQGKIDIRKNLKKLSSI